MKQYFFVKLLPPRPAFPADITPEEQEIMQQHSVYWAGLMAQGKVHVFGPVFDPKGAFGIGVVSAAIEDEVLQWMASDPAARLHMTYEIFPMKAILPARD